MKKRIISAVLVVCSVFCMGLYKGTFAWFATAKEEKHSIVFTVADVSIGIAYENSFDTEALLLPGDTVLSDVKVTNNSDIVTDVRVKVDISVNDTSDSAGFEINKSDDVSEDSGYFVISGLEATETEKAIPIIDSIVCKESCDSSYSGADLDIVLTVQAKQQGVDWTDIGVFVINNENG